MTADDKKQREERLRAAWRRLAAERAFQEVFNLDLQVAFSPVGACFRAEDGWNERAAAYRDGQRSVIAHMARRLGLAAAALDADDDEDEAAAAAKPVESL
ncbi:hypothetical protein WJU23_14515 [Prosthecobacter sp. SYSU 5D2]|uniref:hypothetical protein n=1 Tax=Prosthecobacter sp. SYSU 5D2 TaxID=3134134 RepID=UPI0031FECDE9